MFWRPIALAVLILIVGISAVRAHYGGRREDHMPAIFDWQSSDAQIGCELA
jgi:hypothetical protein